LIANNESFDRKARLFLTIILADTICRPRDVLRTQQLAFNIEAYVQLDKRIITGILTNSCCFIFWRLLEAV